MDGSRDYFTDEITITFWGDEDPEELIPEGWVEVSRVEPEVWKGFQNPGVIICKKESKYV